MLHSSPELRRCHDRPLGDHCGRGRFRKWNQQSAFKLLVPLWVLAFALLTGCPSKPTKPENLTTDAGSDNTEMENEAASNDSAAEVVAAAPSDAEPGNSPGETGPQRAATTEESWLENSSWTTKRLIALSETGPMIIDLQVSIGGNDLSSVSQGYASLILEEIRQDDSETTWNSILEHPLVQSGWLGNLVADDEQQEQILVMYDEGQDQQVTIEEFEKFLTRGLSRNEPLQISDIGNAPNFDSSISPWGAIDSDQDYSVTEEERSVAGERIGRFDFNGDSIVTAQEVGEAQSRQTPTNSMGYQSMLDVSTLYVAHNVDSADTEEKGNATKKLAKQILSRYTFLEGIERRQWSSWSDDAWKQLDSDTDGLLKRNELLAVASMPATVSVKVHFPDVMLEASVTIQAKLANNASSEADGMGTADSSDDEKAELPPESNPSPSPESPGSNVQDVASEQTSSMQLEFRHAAVSVNENPSFVYAAQKDGGRLEVGGLVVELRFEDAFSSTGRELLRNQLSAAVSNDQIQQVFQSQLQLQDGAFDLVDANGNETLDDEEFARLWRWLSARQSSRLMARWMVAENPWFQLLDRNGDRRVGPKELDEAPSVLAELDRDGDDLIAPGEMPLLVRLELERTDNRLESGLFRQGGPPQDAAEMPSDWFSAMDFNQDGFVSHGEFLGESEDFSNLDRDSDGFISRKEVY